ncbi:MBL fold metallo-hydrolase [Acidaminobacter sp. JC074]|uniref:MBL fold metallo-hydrolase n=1 Tax=Acidaminobacter sp. JC074 TaxID=2530199 RepID=UPI001F0EC647|nr:MBL fold metallo-hydrolase [Acidaminobacter sp. JC074]MCH4889633.1 MBL fold metallo-hydrolase [Acidaminobacter sp. JC074]
MNWYKIDRINEELYRISEENHWEKTNIYYFIGENRNLLIDTGTGLFPLRKVLEAIDLKPIDVVLTHAHWDHLGNVHEFENVYVHPEDMEWTRLGLPLPDNKIIEMMTKDVDESNLIDFELPPLKHENPKSIHDFEFDNLRFIHTPGHSPGSLCIYDEKNKRLFSGDTIYEGTVYCHYESTDPVKLKASIDRLSDLDIEKVYPGHYHQLDDRAVDLLKRILDEYKREDKLHHGGGKKCIDKVCVQL